jgi:hypothetical protein
VGGGRERWLLAAQLLREGRDAACVSSPGGQLARHHAPLLAQSPSATCRPCGAPLTAPANAPPCARHRPRALQALLDAELLKAKILEQDGSLRQQREAHRRQLEEQEQKHRALHNLRKQSGGELEALRASERALQAKLQELEATVRGPRGRRRRGWARTGAGPAFAAADGRWRRGRRAGQRWWLCWGGLLGLWRCGKPELRGWTPVPRWAGA